MLDQRALLAAISAHPAEDTPRLAFADWLDEHADTFPLAQDVRARARFIRDDIAMSARDEYDPARLRWELIEKPRREREPWVGATHTPEVLAPERSGGLLRRGFPWWVRLRPSEFLANADRALIQAPGGSLSFTYPDAQWDALARSPHLARLGGLHVRQTQLDPRALRGLVESPHATGIEWLSAGQGGLTAPALPVLAQSPLLARLTRLDLDGRPGAGGAFVNSFAQVRGPVRLRELGLVEAELSGAHLQRLLTSTASETIERLLLAGNRFGLAGHEAIARLPLDRLRKLDLSETAPGAEGFRLLCTSFTLSRLERLGYRRNNVNGALMAELAACHEVSNLRVLDLASNAIGNAGAGALARSPHFAGLLYLNLAYCMIGDAGALALLESSLAESLVLLDLTGAPASAETLGLLKAKMGDRVRL
ncbi:MAG TPA: TIGR02996 domain-containing protein [Gemmata sp.]